MLARATSMLWPRSRATFLRKPTAPEPMKPPYTEGVDLHHTHVLLLAVAEELYAFYHACPAPKLLLTQIAAVEDALHDL